MMMIQSIVIQLELAWQASHELGSSYEAYERAHATIWRQAKRLGITEAQVQEYIKENA